MFHADYAKPGVVIYRCNNGLRFGVSLRVQALSSVFSMAFRKRIFWSQTKIERLRFFGAMKYAIILIS